LTGFLLGAGMYSSFIIFPQFAQLPKSTGFGFGASVVASGLYLLPSTGGMIVVGFASGSIARRFGSKSAVVAGSAITAIAFGYLAVAHGHPYDLLIAAALLGIAIAALGNLVVQAVEPHQTGAAGGMNTVMRTIGGALGGQLAATLIAGHTGADGLPAVTGFTDTFVMAAAFLAVCSLTALLIPGRR